MLIVQGYTAFVAGSRITVGTGVLLVVVALGMVVFVVRNGTALRIRAYGTYFAHAIANLIINGSFWLHVWIRTFTGRDQVLEQGWSGPLISMSVLWGRTPGAHDRRHAEQRLRTCRGLSRRAAGTPRSSCPTTSARCSPRGRRPTSAAVQHGAAGRRVSAAVR